MENLITQRGHIKARLTRFKTYFQKVSCVDPITKNDLIQLAERMESVKPLYDEFLKIHLKISEQNGNLDDLESESELNSFEDNYFDIIASVKYFLGNPSDAGNQATINHNAENAGVNLPLPNISLPSFSGKFEDWQEFHDAFDSMINKNARLSNIQKFYYLMSSLKGEAAQKIKSLRVSDENYAVAWEILAKKYENKKLAVQNNIKALFNLEMLRKESYSSLQSFLDDTLKITHVLKLHNQPSSDTLLIYILSSKLSQPTRNEWELLNQKDKFPTFEEFLDFLDKRCNFLGNIEANKGNQNLLQPGHPPKSSQASAKAYVNTIKYSCIHCKGEHPLYKCENFLKLDVHKRISEARRLRLCLNCLRKNHSVRECTMRPCQRCNRKHNTILHIDYSNCPESDSFNAGSQVVANVVEHPLRSVPSTSATQDAETANQVVCTSSQSNEFNNSKFCHTLLSTACVLISDIHGKIHTGRALLDSGSQTNFISLDFCNRLGLQKTKFKLAISGINNAVASVNHKTEIVVKSRLSDYHSKNISCLIIDEITGYLPVRSFDLSSLNIPPHIKLADPRCNISGKIDLLLGVDIFWELLCIGQHKLGPNKPLLQKTKLGWILSGTLEYNTSLQVDKAISCFTAPSDNIIITNQIEKFWAIEECDNSYSKYSRDEEYCEEHFANNTVRDSDTGRFIVKIPLKNNVNELGDSREVALKRFYSLERKLQRNSSLRKEYSDFLAEFEALGHMNKISESNIPRQPIFYLPHHAVIKQTSTTTKTRVVFDGSAKTTTGISLNDVQYVGPVIQNDLFSILLRFRKYAYVITADIAKMYRQVVVDESQRCLQLILWRSSPDLPISCYQLNRLVYGTASASFLAIRCLKQLAIEFRNKYPVACEAIECDFYVDDLLTGSDSYSRAIQLQSEISEILESAGFELRKWTSNDVNVLSNIAVDNNLYQSKINISEHTETKTLGILWDPKQDSLMYNICDFSKQSKITKRTILSITAQIFDPLGLLAPVIIQAKIIMQKLWQEKVSWDESLSMDVSTAWLNFRNQLEQLNQIEVPRHIMSSRYFNYVELHGFCDASERAYGACVYIRIKNENGSYKTNLLCAKSRVAPLKNVTLPRLELCGALILARLVNKVKEAVKIKFDKCFYWCDSTVTLSWINAAPNKWKTFVANRVAEIHTLTEPSNWAHVNSPDNPADLLSRGVSPKVLKDSYSWWHGPSWLKNNICHWPVPNTIIPNNLECRVITNLAIPDLSAFSKFSSLPKLQRVAAYCRRFINNARENVENRKGGCLAAIEVQDALRNLIKLAQRQIYGKEISQLLQNKPIDHKGSILSLNPFLDDQGILRVGGRIRHSTFSYDKKHPIILPPSHWLTKLICRNEHIRLLHCGPTNLLSSLRNTYWPISGKKLIRKIIHECVPCFRANPKSINPIMGDLPKSRLIYSHPFYNCGVDYAGPVMIKNKRGRGARFIKSYICIFVCFSTKAIHLELVSDLTTECFVAALRRFMSRRGQPMNIYSDNGSNFIGANSELKELGQFIQRQDIRNSVIDSLSESNITWHFIPPRSPHFGGQWEAGVKSVKYHLKRVASNTALTYEEFYTLLTQIEAILNSRPLTPLSQDPNDLSPLTPAHFLIGRKLTSMPEKNFAEVPDNRLGKFEHIQKIRQHFWKRWNQEYVSELQVRTKWRTNHPSLLKPGVLVLIKDENSPPMRWQLGRVRELHPGPDGVTRVVSVMTSNGHVLKRAVCKVCALPSSDE